MSSVQHLINVSGGKDSTAVYLLALERGVPFRAVFADTGNEHPAVYEYVRDLARKTGGPEVEWVSANFDKEIAAKRLFIANDRRIGRRNGKRVRWTNKAKRRALEVLQPTGNPYLDLCLWKGRFPSRKAQSCTAELKALPITERIVLPMLRSGPVLQWLGVRSDESEQRRHARRFNRDDSGAYLWRPILAWAAQDCFNLHRRHGLGPNPLYALGFGRVGCMLCINCGKKEIRLASKHAPDDIARLRRWEPLVAAASKRGAATFFPLVVQSANRNGGRITNAQLSQQGRIDEVVRWARTTRGGKNFDLFADQPGGGCDSDMALCETGETL